MTGPSDDDKPTVILDLNALKKAKLAKEEEFASIVKDLEFAVGPDSEKESTEEFTESFLVARAQNENKPYKIDSTPIILFDYDSDFFKDSKKYFPENFKYHIAKTLPELNKFLANKTLQIVVFNYDSNSKVVNQLTAQIKQKFPMMKTLIIAKAVSPEKAKVHAQSQFGANGYLQLPLDTQKISNEFKNIISKG